MDTENRFNQEKCYYRAVIISHEKLKEGVRGLNRTLQKKINATGDISKTNARFASFNHSSNCRPPKFLYERIKENKGKYIYEILCADVNAAENKKHTMFSAPTIDLLKEARPNLEQMKHVRFDIQKICADQFYGSSESDIKVVRLNARLAGDIGNTVNTVALYGEDIFNSRTLNRVIGLKSIKDDLSRDFNPFVDSSDVKKEMKNLGQTLFIHPKSCRLKWDDGTGNHFSLNVDNLGNCSFYLNKISSLLGFEKIINYAKNLNALIEFSSIDPLKRSSKAIDSISL